MELENDANLALFKAVVNGDAPGVAGALAAGAEVDKPEELSGCPPLSWAARMGSLGCVRALVSAGADVWGGASGKSPMDCAAAAEGKDLLLAMLAGSSAKRGPKPALAMFKKALAEGASELAVALVESGAVDPDGRHPGPKPVNEESPPLHLAAAAKDAAALSALLRAGAKPDLKMGEPGLETTASQRAALDNWPEGLRLLLAAGADPDGVEGPGGLARAAARGMASMMGQSCVEAYAALEAAGGKVSEGNLGSELIERAARAKDFEAFQWLCERGVDPHEPERPAPAEPGKRIRGARSRIFRSAMDVVREMPGSPFSILVRSYLDSRREKEKIAQVAACEAQAKPARRI